MFRLRQNGASLPGPFPNPGTQAAGQARLYERVSSDWLMAASQTGCLDDERLEAVAGQDGGTASSAVGESVVLATQTANVGSMRLAAKLGFTEMERFQAWDAEQWLGLRSPVVPPA